MNGNRKKYLALVVAGGLALAACGGDDDNDAIKSKSSDAGVVIDTEFASAADATADAGSARMRLSIEMAMPGAAEPAAITAEGATDFVTGNSQLTMDMSSLFGALGASALGADTLGAIGGDATIEMRIVDGVIYAKYPESIGQFLGDATWLKLDPGDVSSDPDASGGMTNPFSQANPKQYLDYLATVSSGVEEVGREEVDGVATTHYRANLDFGKTLDQVPQETLDQLGLDADAFAQQLEALGEQMGGELPVDVWIDDDDLLRQMTMHMSAMGQSVDLKMEMYDYGADIVVEAPPADEVGDMGSLFDDFGGSFGDEEVAA